MITEGDSSFGVRQTKLIRHEGYITWGDKSCGVKQLESSKLRHYHIQQDARAGVMKHGGDITMR